MSAQQDEWTDWIVHDGKGCPCVGQMVDVVTIRNLLGDHGRFTAIARGGRSWTWAITGAPPNEWQQIIRYRIRRPKGMAILNAILADLPAPPVKQPAPGVIA